MIQILFRKYRYMQILQSKQQCERGKGENDNAVAIGDPLGFLNVIAEFSHTGK